MPRYIQVKRGTFGLIYIIRGGEESGRTLTVDRYAKLLEAGVPVVRG
jgi:hypothetical protein